jgi:hypothetical protein
MKDDPCLCCGRDTRRDADEHWGEKQLMCGCGRFFCTTCTKNIYEYGTFTECPKCGRPLNIRRSNAADLNEAEESEKIPD